MEKNKKSKLLTSYVIYKNENDTVTFKEGQVEKLHNFLQIYPDAMIIETYGSKNPFNSLRNYKKEIKRKEFVEDSILTVEIDSNRENKKRKARIRAKEERDKRARLNIKKKSTLSDNKDQIKIFSDGNYNGKLDGGERNGKGVFTYRSGEVYSGSWLNDKRNGKGKLIWKNGNVYDGGWLDDKRRGKGKVTYKSSGVVYEGDFINGKFNGKGRLTSKDNSFVEGVWSNNILDPSTAKKAMITIKRSNSQKRLDGPMKRVIYKIRVKGIIIGELNENNDFQKEIEVNLGSIINLTRSYKRKTFDLMGDDVNPCKLLITQSHITEQFDCD